MSEEERFVGIWRLLEVTSRRVGSKETSRPYGDAPHGRLIYDGAGRMTAVMFGSGMGPFGGDTVALVTADEALAAFRASVAYYGTYTVDAAAGTVTHHVEGSLHPNWVGGDQVRFYSFDGDRLVLSTPPLDTGGGGALEVILTWRRDA